MIDFNRRVINLWLFFIIQATTISHMLNQIYSWLKWKFVATFRPWKVWCLVLLGRYTWDLIIKRVSTCLVIYIAMFVGSGRMHMNQTQYTPFHWLGENVVHEHPIDSSNVEDVNRVLLASRPSQTTIQYIHMKTYGNHFRWKIQRVFCPPPMIMALFQYLICQLLILVMFLWIMLVY